MSNNNAIARTTQVDQFLADWKKQKEFATDLIKSGFLPKCYQTPEQVMAVMLKGKELDIPPMEALNNLYPLNGRIGIMGQLMLALVRRKGLLGGFLITFDEQNESATVWARRKDTGEEFRSTFSKKDAITAGIMKADSGHMKYPWQMRQWRALANCFRVLFPDVLSGMYLPEELGIPTQVDEEANETIGDFTEAVVLDLDNADTKYPRILEALRINIKLGKKEHLEEWKTLWKSDIEKMSEKFQGLLKREYNVAMQKYYIKETNDGTVRPDIEKFKNESLGVQQPTTTEGGAGKSESVPSV